MLELKKINVNDLIDMIEKLGQSHNTAANVASFSENPVHILLYNEMMKFSKEELEEATGYHPVFKSNLFKTVMRAHSYLAFVALMEKEAFVNELLPENQWFLKECEVKNLDFYHCLHQGESLRFFNKEKKYSGLSFVLSYYHQYFNSLEDNSRNIIAEKIYQQFEKEQFSTLNHFVFNNISSRLSQSLLEIFKKNYKNINEIFILNNVLPKENDSDKNFWLSSASNSHIIKALEAGYQLNEESYYFRGYSLMENLLLHGSDRNVSTIMPYLTRAKPVQLSYGEQHALLDKFKKLSNFDELQSHYFQLVENEYDRIMPEKPFQHAKKKI